MSRKPLVYKMYNRDDSQIPQADFLDSHILIPLEISKFLFVFISESCCLSKKSPWLHNWTMFAREVLFAVCIDILFITPLDLSEKVQFFFLSQTNASHLIPVTYSLGQTTKHQNI